jgi:hypothetical protein
MRALISNSIYRFVIVCVISGSSIICGSRRGIICCSIVSHIVIHASIITGTGVITRTSIIVGRSLNT